MYINNYYLNNLFITIDADINNQINKNLKNKGIFPRSETSLKDLKKYLIKF